MLRILMLRLVFVVSPGVIPAQAGIQPCTRYGFGEIRRVVGVIWMPASAGMTKTAEHHLLRQPLQDLIGISTHSVETRHFLVS
jgi:hypothetical protein